MRHLGIFATLLALTITAASAGWVSAVGAEPPAADQGQAASPLDAATQVDVEVIILHGTNDGTGIDPRIGDVPQLKQPPFSSYNSYKLLGRKQAALKTNAAQKLALPNGDKLALTFTGEKNKRYELSVAITRPKGEKLLGLDVKSKPGELFFVAGPKHEKGILVLGIRVLAPRKK